jgi:probable HAF family extracellular repeat protein
MRKLLPCFVLLTIADASAAEYVAVRVPVPESTNVLAPRTARVVDVNSRGDVLAVDCYPNIYFDGAYCKAVLWSSRNGSYRELFPTCALGSCAQRVADVQLKLNDRGEVGGRTGGQAVIWSEKTGLRALGPVEPYTGPYQGVVAFNDRGEIGGTSWRNDARAYAAMFASESAGVRLLDSVSSSIARDMNDNGEIVGTATVSPTGPGHAFYWSPRRGFLDIGALIGPVGSGATAINKQGTVAVYAENLLALWDEQHGVFEKVPIPGDCGVLALTSKGEVTGLCANWSGAPATAWMWSKKQGFRRLGTVGYEVLVEDRNADGSLVGSFRTTPTGTRRAFVWTIDGGAVDLDPGMPSRTSVAWAISDDGVVGGVLGDGSFGNTQPVIWVPRKP